MVWWSVFVIARLKSVNVSYFHMYVWQSLYRTSKFKSANILFAMVIWDPSAKFNSHQYIWLYGIHYC